MDEMNKREKVCDECGCVIEGEVVEIDGREMCEDCAADWVQCASCGEWIKRDDAYEGADGKLYCESCFYDNFTYCERCGAVEYIDDIIAVADNPYQRRRGNIAYYCRRCAEERAYQCEGCGEWYFTTTTTRDGEMCEDCLSDYYYCDECGDYVTADDYDSEAGMCTRCAEERGDGGAYIGRYHERPSLEYFGKCHPAWRGVWRGVGVELEIDRHYNDHEAEANCVERLNEIGGDHIYFNRDGSLENGFEIITQPHTVEALYAMPWREILSACKDCGYLSHDAETCGLHLHISREFFGTNEQRQGVAVSKLIRFYDNFYNEILKVSRRTEEQAAHWAARYGTKTRKDAEQFGKKKTYAGRYYAVNNTNSRTVEIRIMRGTLNYNTFLACIDFMITTARNARRVRWDRVNSAAEWLRGIRPETADYLNRLGAFGYSEV